MTNIAERVHTILLDKKIKITLAESCTGGKIAVSLIENEKASNYFQLGLVIYSIQSKIEVLHVKKDVIDKYGVVSREVAEELAQNARIIIDSTDIGLGITGLAGPDSDEKFDSGTAFVAIATAESCFAKKLKNNGNRKENIELFTKQALYFLLEILQDKFP